MRCKKHIADASSAAGVCASCLRERLFVLIESQSQPLPLPPPPPLVLPRSVSPYISRRKSDTSSMACDDSDFSVIGDRKPRFFSTPQAGPSSKTKKKSKFSLFKSLFRSGSAKSRSESDPGSSVSDPNISQSELYAYHSRKSVIRLSSLDETSSSSSVYEGRRHRGMSPDDVGCSPDSWKRTPNRPSQGRVTASPARSQLASGIGFCLSPLMRPSPGRHWKGKATGLETGYSGEVRPAQLSAAASLRANRSRKLADFGRFDHNR